MQVIQITQFSEKVLEAINELLPQLSSSARILTESELTEIIRSESSHLLMAEESGIFHGSLTLVTFKIPTGIRAWIEDVVVNENARGKGVGQLLSDRAIDLAREMGAKTVDLTSRPSREAANALYKKVGFERRETNVYRYTIS
jgi:ribosomal protein S18 acetylase RimI-like enzyme